MRQDIVDSVRTWLETPYHHQARVKGAGVDCAQLIAGVAEECGYIEPGVAIQNYSTEWHLHNREERMLQYLEEFGCKLKEEPAQPGDILCFKFGRVCSHLGILVPENKFIHARIDVHKVVLNSLSGDWLKRHVRTYSFPTEKIR